jgi:predicted nucleic acid-binding protein
MKPFLLDTNIIVDALRKRNDRHPLVDQFLDQGQPLASCPITITEIYAGMRPHEEKPTRAFMRSLLFFPIADEIAEAAGLLSTQDVARPSRFRTPALLRFASRTVARSSRRTSGTSRCRSFSSIPCQRETGISEMPSGNASDPSPPVHPTQYGIQHPDGCRIGGTAHLPIATAICTLGTAGALACHQGIAQIAPHEDAAIKNSSAARRGRGK